jgi:hypothetical protein
MCKLFLSPLLLVVNKKSQKSVPMNLDSKKDEVTG